MVSDIENDVKPLFSEWPIGPQKGALDLKFCNHQVLGCSEKQSERNVRRELLGYSNRMTDSLPIIYRELTKDLGKFVNSWDKVLSFDSHKMGYFRKFSKKLLDAHVFNYALNITIMFILRA